MSINDISELESLDEMALREYVEGNKKDYDHYGLPVVELENGVEYAIAFDDEEADRACTEYIQYSVWAFNASFIADMTDLPVEIFEVLERSNMCDSLNPAIMACIEQTCGIEEFVDAAVRADGRGHFLGTYDGYEYELESGAYAYELG